MTSFWNHPTLRRCLLSMAGLSQWPFRQVLKTSFTCWMVEVAVLVRSRWFPFFLCRFCFFGVFSSVKTLCESVFIPFHYQMKANVTLVVTLHYPPPSRRPSSIVVRILSVMVVCGVPHSKGDVEHDDTDQKEEAELERMANPQVTGDAAAEKMAKMMRMAQMSRGIMVRQYLCLAFVALSSLFFFCFFWFWPRCLRFAAASASTSTCYLFYSSCPTHVYPRLS